MVQIRPRLEEGIDRRELDRIRGRFMSLGNARLERATLALSSRQQQVLRLLPLLLHVNHPLLPGYVSGNTPCGFSDYQPGPALIREAQGLARSFAYRQGLGQHTEGQLYSLFLMGNLGSLAQGLRSNMDFWLCHDPRLQAVELEALKRKCDALQAWALSLGASARIFLINPDDFSADAAGAHAGLSDSSHLAWRYLLLDEFYRTCMWLAGRIPLWWYVPDYEEHRYAEYCRNLLGRRFVRPEEVVDLGYVAFIPQSECIAAALRQIDKGVEDPGKMLPALLLIQSYAAQDAATPLCVQLKASLYAADPDSDVLDAHVLVYQRLEVWLQGRQETERLELLRRCFYVACAVSLGMELVSRQADWRRALLSTLTVDWGWDVRGLRRLDNRSRWRVADVQPELKLLVKELEHGHALTGEWIGAQADCPAQRQQWLVLQRRLQAAFGPRQHKVEQLNPAISADMAEPALTLAALPGADGTHWALYPGNLARQDLEHRAPLKRMDGLLALLSWAWRNRILAGTTALSLLAEKFELPERVLPLLLQLLEREFAGVRSRVPEAALMQPARTDFGVLLINLAVEAVSVPERDEILVATEQVDPLDFSGRRENLVVRLDLLTLNSWHELCVHTFAGEQALLDALLTVLRLQQGQQVPAIKVFCLGRVRAQAIANRVQQVLQGLFAQQTEGPARYLLQVREGFYCVRFAHAGVEAVHLPSLADLQEYAARPEEEGLPWVLDGLALQGHPLGWALGRGQADALQFFFRVAGSEASLYVLDERNALFFAQIPFQGEAALLAHWQAFFKTMGVRRDAVRAAAGLLLQQDVQVEYFRLLPEGTRPVQTVERCVPATAAQPLSGLPLQAVVGASGALTLYCADQVFSGLEMGGMAWQQAVRALARSCREAGVRGCCLTDLDMDSAAGGPPQTSVVLRYKADLEQRLNQALQTALIAD